MPSVFQAFKIVSAAALLALAGLTLAGSVVALIVATPIFVIFSPVLVPATIATTFLAANLSAGALFGVTAAALVVWLLKHKMGVHPKDNPPPKGAPPIYKPGEEEKGKSKDKPAGGEKGKSKDKPAGGEKDKSKDKPAGGEKDKSKDKPAGGATDKPGDKPAGGATAKPGGKPAGGATDKPGDKPAGGPKDKPAGGAADKPAGGKADKPAGGKADKPAGKPKK